MFYIISVLCVVYSKQYLYRSNATTKLSTIHTLMIYKGGPVNVISMFCYNIILQYYIGIIFKTRSLQVQCHYYTEHYSYINDI